MTNYNGRLDEILAKHGAEPGEMTHSFKQALTSLIQELALEARIDEMDVALAEVTHWSIDDSDSAIHGYGKHRIAELKQELESYDQL